MPNEPGGALGLTVKDLSQKFVDQLCDGDVLSDDLQHEVESVIFRHLDGDAQMACEDFTELREFRTAGIRESREDLKTQIRATSQEIADLDERRAAIQKKSVRRAQLPGLLSASQDRSQRSTARPRARGFKTSRSSESGAQR